MTRRTPAATLALLLGIGGALAISTPASAATLTVTSEDDSGPGSLRQAVADANPGDVIEFDASVTLIELATGIELGDGITIDGGTHVVISRANTSTFDQLVFAPDSAAQDYVLRNLTIQGIAGGEGQAVATTDGGGFGPREITFSNLTVRDETAPTAPIANLSAATGDVLIESSQFDGNQATGGEGGIWLYGATSDSIRVLDSRFIGNQAEYGAALDLEGLTSAEVEIVDSTFTDNTAVVAGGAILFWDNPGSTLSVIGSTFTENSTPGESGAINVAQASGFSISGSTFEGNSGLWGGAIQAHDLDSLTIAGSAFTGNETTSNGGAVFIETIGSAVQITGSTFTSNGAAWGGALSIDVSNGLTVRASTFSGNRAVGQGGAIHANRDAGAPIVIDSSTFTGQEYSGGGAGKGVSISIDSIDPAGSLDIVNSTIDETEATGSGLSVEEAHGPLVIRNSTIRATWVEFSDVAGTTGTIVNSIVEAQAPGEEPVVVGVSAGGTFATSYSVFNGPLDDDIDAGDGVLAETDPHLHALADNGGPTLTRLPEVGSPAIDAGDPAFAPPPAVDQRGTGFARLASARVDLGAVEVQAPSLSTTGVGLPWWLVPAAGGVLLLGSLVLVLGRRGAREV